MSGSDDCQALAIGVADNVAVALADLAAGSLARVRIGAAIMDVTTVSAIPLGHKLALTAIGVGEDVVKYGAVMARATRDIAPGEHVHVHNVASRRAGGGS